MGGGVLDQGHNINTSVITIQIDVEPHSHGLKVTYLRKVFPFNLDYEWILGSFFFRFISVDGFP